MAAKITILPEKEVLTVTTGITLYEGLRQHKIFFEHACGGRAKCGRCKVRILAPGELPPPTPEEEQIIAKKELGRGVRLACCFLVTGDLTLELVTTADGPASIHTEGFLPDFPLATAIKKLFISLPAPSLADNLSDLERLQKYSGQPAHPVYLAKLIPKLPSLLREAEFKVTLALLDGQITVVEPSDTSNTCYGVAVDIGTTTVVVSLIDLVSGKEVAIASELNAQRPYGMDVLSRISHCQQHPQEVTRLHQLIISKINSLITNLCQQAQIKRELIYQLTVAGNTTMLQLFVGVTPRWLGRSPYIAAFAKGLRLRADDLGISISSGGEAIIMPCVSAYIGGDIVAGLLVSDIFSSPTPGVLIDLGTNGEVVLAAGGKLLGTSCAAGPAFEGMNISCGMPALPGAIERVSIEQQLNYATIAGEDPKGLCGSAVIDLAAEMVRCGIVDKGGRLATREKLQSGDYPFLASHLDEVAGVRVFWVAKHNEERVYFSQQDFRQIQMAKGAISSAVSILLSEAGLDIKDLAKVVLAGGFGKAVSPHSFVQLGIVPSGFDGEIEYIGNSSKTGAIMVLLNNTFLARAETLRSQVKTIELSIHPNYDRILAAHLRF